MNKLALALIGSTLSASAFAVEPTTTVAATGLMGMSTAVTTGLTVLVPLAAVVASTVIAESNNTVSTVSSTK